MSITHIIAPANIPKSAFDPGFTPPPVGSSPSPQLASKPAFDAPDDSVSTGPWEATPGVFISGHATFVTADGRRFEFRGGDAAYFPPNTHGVWTIHETLRKTYCIWK
jgi:uncharacterized cupin superfamily protein